MDLGATQSAVREVFDGSACPVKATCKGTSSEEGPESFPAPKPRRVKTERLVAVVDLDEHGLPIWFSVQRRVDLLACGAADGRCQQRGSGGAQGGPGRSRGTSRTPLSHRH